MAHDKVYGICENKCFVEVPTKERIDEQLGYSIKNTLTVGNFIDLDFSYKVSRLVKKLQITQFQRVSGGYSLKFNTDISLVNGCVDCYVILSLNTPIQYKTDLLFEKVPAKIHYEAGRGIDTSITISFEHSEVSNDYNVTVVFDYY